MWLKEVHNPVFVVSAPLSPSSFLPSTNPFCRVEESGVALDTHTGEVWYKCSLNTGEMEAKALSAANIWIL